VNKCGQNELHEKHPERILFVGNETALDVVGGNNMGWKTVLIKTTETSSNGLATWDISNLDELLDIIFPT
jgi:FMN phosphatase YigB (HAD superfamily)